MKFCTKALGHHSRSYYSLELGKGRGYRFGLHGMVQSPSFSHEVTTIALLSVWHEIQTSNFKIQTVHNGQ